LELLDPHGVALAPKAAGPARRGRNSRVAFVLEHARSAAWLPPAHQRRWQSPPPPAPPAFSLYEDNDCLHLQIHVAGDGLFSYHGDSIDIAGDHAGFGLSHYLAGIGLAIPLEIRGVVCLHANSVSCNDILIALLGTSTAGKSTLSAALCRRGHGLHTDDMIALHPEDGDWRIYPGQERMRLWPDSAAWMLGEEGADALPRVDARYEKRVLDVDTAQIEASRRACLLSRLYLLDRNDEGRFGISCLTESESLVVLMQESLIGSAAKALGIEVERFARLAAICRRIPLRRLSYPSDYAQLDDVCAMIEADA
jgi:hypothetical protein